MEKRRNDERVVKMNKTKLSWLVRKGRFNWANQNDVSTNIHLHIIKDGEKVAVINLTLDEDDYEHWNNAFDDNPLGAVQECVKEYEDKVWVDSGKERRTNFKKVFRENYQQIEKTWIEDKIVKLEKRLDKTKTELNKYKNYLKYCEEPLREEDLPFPEIMEREK